MCDKVDSWAERSHAEGNKHLGSKKVKKNCKVAVNIQRNLIQSSFCFSNDVKHGT